MSPSRQKQSVRVRIAPSPTGPLHVGTARTALFNFLFARHTGGQLVLRIEDTDKERSEARWEEDIVAGLSWLGIAWDEGPLRQSERRESHSAYLEKLLGKEDAFYCSHTKEVLEQERRVQAKNKETPRHICEDRDKNFTEGEVIRFRNPGGIVMFNDMVRGDITFDADLLGDFSIARSVKNPLYNFAAVIDDHDMRISHVIRGEDHISNTPKQILIFRALGIEPPRYAHLPLVLGTDRSKLSKRHGPVSLLEYKKEGYLASAMQNFLGLLGWRPAGDEEIFSLEDMIKSFDFSDVQKSGAIFDKEKLNWINGVHIRALSPEELAKQVLPHLREAGIDTSDMALVRQVMTLEQERLVTLSEIGERARFFFQDTVQYNWELLIWKDMTKTRLKKVLVTLDEIIAETPDKLFSDSQKLEEHWLPYAEKEGDKGILLWPLRAALSGRKTSPGPFDILAILGKKMARERIAHARSLI